VPLVTERWAGRPAAGEGSLLSTSCASQLREPSMRVRLSIGHLLGVVGFCGIGFAALADPSELWASCLFTLALCVLGLICLGAAFGQGQRRASYAGAGFFGWGYMLLAFGPWFASEVRPHLATTWVINNLPQRNPGIGILECPDDNTVVPGPPPSFPIGGFQRWAFSTPVTMPASFVDSRQRIGHCLFALIATLVGRIAAQSFVARSQASS
jgi:hypothetical protein